MGFRKTCGLVNCAVESCQPWSSQPGMFTRKSKHSRGCCRCSIEHSNFRENVRDVRSNMASCRADVADVRRNICLCLADVAGIRREVQTSLRQSPAYDRTSEHS